MLASGTYDEQYVRDCRGRIDAQVAAYAEVRADEAFEVVFFTGLLLQLELMFVHRLRGKELKDGNPLNEVRLLAASVLTNGGKLPADKGIRLRPETSVLGHAVGDPIALREADFRALAAAFFAEVDRKFVER